MIQKDGYLRISDEQIAQIRKEFETYTKSFLNNNKKFNQHIELKRFHTKKVCENILDISRSLQMDQQQLNFAELLAYMHDIGRFEQYKKHHTFNDSESENHAEIAIQVIKERNILKFLDQEQINTIYQAIRNHNIRRVPKNKGPITDFYSRLLRDSDKLDIWRLNIEMNIMYKIQDGPLPEKYNIPSGFIEIYKEYRPLSIDMAKDFYDTIIFRLSWIFDLNFKRSFELMKERDITDKLLKKVPPSVELEQIRKLTYDYLDLKCR